MSIATFVFISQFIQDLNLLSSVVIQNVKLYCVVAIGQSIQYNTYSLVNVCLSKYSPISKMKSDMLLNTSWVSLTTYFGYGREQLNML